MDGSNPLDDISCLMVVTDVAELADGHYVLTASHDGADAPDAEVIVLLGSGTTIEWDDAVDWYCPVIWKSDGYAAIGLDPYKWSSSANSGLRMFLGPDGTDEAMLRAIYKKFVRAKQVDNY